MSTVALIVLGMLNLVLRMLNPVLRMLNPVLWILNPVLSGVKWQISSSTGDPLGEKWQIFCAFPGCFVLRVSSLHTHIHTYIHIPPGSEVADFSFHLHRIPRG